MGARGINPCAFFSFWKKDDVKNSKMTHGSLFSGIGGAELAASWMGWENIFHCEINPFGRRVIDYWFPKSKSYEDITKTDFKEWRGKVDVLTGGFPCQPFSQAGQRKGDTDDRYLWPEMLRVIREVHPTWVIGENVGGITSMVESGEDVEMGHGTDIFEESIIYRKEQKFTIERICKDFESIGYAIQPVLIPACAVGAPHRRDRVWFIAHTDINRQRKRKDKQKFVEECKRKADNCVSSEDGIVASTNDERLRRCEESGISGKNWEKENKQPTRFFRSDWSKFPAQSPICSRNDGISDRLDGITFPAWRAESIKAYGNAWVPQVAYEIFKEISFCENMLYAST